MIQILFTILATHFTIVCVTLFLHRGMAHRSLEFSPILSHLMRFWLWLTTGMVTKEWVAIHRKHHRFTDVDGDPHSPKMFGIKRVFFKGTWLYRDAAKDNQTVSVYGVGTPDDWLEKRIYAPLSWLGPTLLLGLNVLFFGWFGIISWLIQILWIPFWAAGFINGIGHFSGYRNFHTNDSSHNIFPWGIIVGGEELHNNHHENPASSKLSFRPFEFDIGWAWIKFFEFFKLIKIKSI